jgi:hypothetical protein
MTRRCRSPPRRRRLLPSTPVPTRSFSNLQKTHRNYLWRADGSLYSASQRHPYASPVPRPWCVLWHSYVNRADASARLAELQAAFVEGGISRQFHVSEEVAILGVSLFVLGLGLGPLVAGPMSEIYGRSAVYHVSFGFFFVFLFPVAFAPNISKCVVPSSRA